jgi:hypothetical protein
MQARFLHEDKPGVAMREGGPFSTWWCGGLRTTAYLQNMVGLLAETQGNPSPIQEPSVLSRIMPDGDDFVLVDPQTGLFRHSLSDSVTANLAVFDYASRYSEQLLLGTWKAAVGRRPRE